MATKENAIPNREFKDRLFRFIFGNNKKFLLSLYNAVNSTHYTNEEELTVTTLEDVLYLNMKNDVSFILDTTMNLYEHQSSICKNMPIRGLMYYGEVMQNYLKENKKNLYSSTRIQIPAPRYYVFYNGEKDAPDREVQKLSDSFEFCENSELNTGYEWTAIILNINKGHNRELMEQCAPLAEYADFVAMVRKYKEIYPLKDAIDKAVNDAADFPHIGSLLMNSKGAVVNMLLTEFNQKEYDEMIREEERNSLLSVLFKKDKITLKTVAETLGVSEQEALKIMKK